MFCVGNSGGVAVGNRKLEAALQCWNRLIFLVDLEIVVRDIGIEVECAWLQFLFVHPGQKPGFCFKIAVGIAVPDATSRFRLYTLRDE